MKKVTKQTIGIYLEHLKRHKWLTFFTWLGLFIGVASDSVIPIYLKKIVDAMTPGFENVQISDVMMLLAPFTIIYVVNLFGWRLGGYCMTFLEPKIMGEITDECFTAVHKHSFNFFNNEFVGSLVKRVNRLVRAFEAFMDIVSFELFTNAVRIVIAVAVLYWVNPIFGISMLVWVVIFILGNYYISLYKLKKYDVHRAAAESATTAYLADTISNNANIKLFSNRKYEVRGFAKVVENWRKRATDSWLFSAHMDSSQNFLMMVLEIFMIYMLIKLWGQGLVTLGDFVMIQGYLINLFVFSWGFGRNVRRLYEAFADAEEMTEILHKPIEIEDVPGAVALVATGGKVEFKNVNFSYEGGEGDEGVIRDLSLTIKPSEKIALIGPSGGGKSTIVKLILRLFDVDSGEILVDGQNISQVQQDSVRAQIALVPQDPILFHRSLMDNIRYGRLDASDEEVIAASKMAHCHEFIDGFPKKYNTFVGERGVKLSGGERQRVAIARAILSNAKILILDEATSSLDVHSERLIQDALAHLSKDKTTIVIAHRLSTVTNVDRIIVLEDGKIAEEGVHSELMRKEGGLYKSLWDLSVEAHIA